MFALDPAAAGFALWNRYGDGSGDRLGRCRCITGVDVVADTAPSVQRRSRVFPAWVADTAQPRGSVSPIRGSLFDNDLRAIYESSFGKVTSASPLAGAWPVPQFSSMFALWFRGARALCVRSLQQKVTPFPCRTMPSTIVRIRGVAASILGVAACSLTLSCGGSKDSTSSTRVGPPAQLNIVSGDAQSGTVAKELAQPLVVRVVDANGNPVQGQSVNFRVTAGGGTVFAGSSNTNADGVAQERWTLGTVAGAEQTVEARAVDNATGKAIVFATFHATAVADAPAALTVNRQPVATAQSGSPLTTQPAVQLADKYGNVVTRSGIQITASIGAPGNGYTLGGTTTVATDNTGVASFTDLTITGAAGTVTLSFAAPSLTAVSSSGIALAAGAPTQLAAVGPTSFSGTVGAPLTSLPKVIVRDAAGNPVSGVSVIFAVSNEGGTITPTSVATDVNGQAALSSWILPKAAGSASVIASVSAIPNVTVTFTATAGVGGATHLARTDSPALGGQVGTSIPVTLRVTDDFGNAVAGASVSFAVGVNSGAVSAAGGTAGSTATATSDPTGNLTVSWTLGVTAGQQTLNASLSGGPSLTMQATARAGAAAAIALDRPPSASAASGAVFAVQPIAVLRDQYGNAVAQSGVVITASAASLYTLIGTSTATTDAMGHATFSGLGITGPVGSAVLSFSSPSLNATTAAVQIGAGSPATLSIVSGDNQNGISGKPLANGLVVKLTDQAGNPIAGATITWTTPDGGTLNPTQSTTNSSGEASSVPTLGPTAGTNHVVAALASASSVQVTFTATGAASAATHLTAVTPPPASATVGTTAPVAVRVTDDNGNTVAGALVSFVVGVNSGAVSAPGGTAAATVTATADATGNATVAWTLGTVPGQQTLTASLSNGPSLTLTTTTGPGPAAKLAFDRTPSANATSGSIFPVEPILTIEDQYGNAIAQGGATITASVGSPYTLLGTTTATTDASGRATFTNLGLTGPVGSAALTFASTSLTSVSSNVQVSAGMPANVSIMSGDNQTGVVGQQLANPLVVKVVDAQGNPVQGQAVSFKVTAGGGTVFAGTSNTNSDGIAQERWTLGTVAGSSQTLEARAVDNVTGQPIVFATFHATALAGPATKIATDSGNNATVVAGSGPLTVVARVTDQYDNSVSGASVTWSVTSGQATLSATTSASDSSGRAAITVTPTTPGTVQVTAALSNAASAVFTLTVSTPIYTLHITLDGTGAGTVASVPAGISCTLSGSATSGQCSANFTSGTNVTLTAAPANGSSFGQWSGACGGASTCNLTIDRSLSANATFTVLPLGVLTVNGAGTGAGTVSSSPAGIRCTVDSGSTSGSCSQGFVNGTSVTLTATSNVKSRFDGWTGDCSGTGQCVLDMSKNHNVSATFTRSTYTLTIAGAGTGTGVLIEYPLSGSCSYTAGAANSPCSYEIPAGTSIQVLPTYTATGTSFTGWSGDCSGTGNCQLTMNANHSVTGTFTRVSYTLTLLLSGTGTGTVTSNTGLTCSIYATGIGGPISTTVQCPAQVPVGTNLTLTATASPGSAFTGWFGACSGKSTTCTITMNSDTTINGGITLLTYPVTVNGSGAGSGTVTGGFLNCSIVAGSASGTCATDVYSGRTITLVATPATGSLFSGWGGVCSGTQTTCLTGVQTSGVTATASFALASTLTITGSAPPSGQSFRVTSSDSKVNCTITTSGAAGQCSVPYAQNSAVSLTFSRSGTSFSMQWSSDGPNECNGSLAASASGIGSCTLTMSGNRTVTLSQ